MAHTKNIPVAVLCAGLLGISMSTFAQTKKKSYDKSVFGSYQSSPQNTAAAEKSIQSVHTQFPGWAVATDKLSGAFVDIYGIPVSIDGSTNAEKAINCISDKLAQLGLRPADWKQVSDLKAPKADYVNYVQEINGHPVVFSRISFRFTKEGSLERIQIKNYGIPKAGMAPTISMADAKAAAIKDLDGVNITANDVAANWSWFPVPSATGYELHPAWSFTVKGRVPGSVPLTLNGYIDALNGNMLYRSNQVKETGFDVTVKGVVYKDGTLHPATSQPLTDLYVVYGADTVYTDTAGLGSAASLVLPLTASMPLAGRWSTVWDSATATMPLFTDAVSVAGTTYTYPTTAPSSDRHVNAYYHVNRVHNFMKGYFGATFTGMDSSLPTNVDMGSGTCNAFYSGRDINFYTADAYCHSFAELGDVIYHEYGHGISDHFYRMVTGGSIMNGSLNEASSDIWALSITHSPILAQNAYVGYGGFIRRYDMMPQVYPLDWAAPGYADVHKNGQIIAGTWWDLGIALGSEDSMTKYFTDVYYDAPDGPDGTEGAVFQSMLIDVLLADDNNHNLFDGTPHYNQIISAFARHGLYLEGDVTVTHTELGIQPPAAAIPVSAYLNMTNSSHFKDLTMYYRINSTGTWNPTPMVHTGPRYIGAIPAQTAGTTVEYYFIVHDTLNVENAYFPTACNHTMTANQTNIPYQFAVGVQSIDSNNFEGSVTGWHIGSNGGDDATDGLWQQAIPSPNPVFPTWPSGDHTNGLGQCLVTGSGIGGSGFYGLSVTNGTTTVLTPVFDVSSYTTPVVSYYRWFSNEQGFENFKKDPWVVKIRNAANSSWQTVEDTYQGEDNWRHRIFPVSAFLPATTTQIQLQFFASDSIITSWDNNAQGMDVGGVDDFILYDKQRFSGVPMLASQRPQIFPNPADDKIQVVMPSGNTAKIALYDMAGRIASENVTDAGNGNYSIDTRALAAGSYSLTIQTDAYIISQKVVVVHP